MMPVLLALCGCRDRAPDPASVAAPEPAVRVSDPADYPRLVGQRVEVVGVVGDAKCPQVQRLHCWELDEYRGRAVHLAGVLRATVVTEQAIAEETRKYGFPLPGFGPGTHYHIEGMGWQLLP